MTATPIEKLEIFIGSLIEPEGYELVALDVVTHHTKTLRLYIDRKTTETYGNVSLEDCIKVTKLIDEPLDKEEVVDQVFKGSFELEVSSPGIERPLRKEKDYLRFKNEQARIHLFRPLTAEETENVTYCEKNPKQKNYLGDIAGFENGKVILKVSFQDGKTSQKKKGSKSQKAETKKERPVVKIPLALITSANLEPDSLRFTPEAGETIFEL